jgi:hypothetical protein
VRFDQESRMASPPPDWHQDGRGVMSSVLGAELLR